MTKDIVITYDYVELQRLWPEFDLGTKEIAKAIQYAVKNNTHPVVIKDRDMIVGAVLEVDFDDTPGFLSAQATFNSRSLLRRFEMHPIILDVEYLDGKKEITIQCNFIYGSR